jgi:EAL domain-containing protein (putative c-di-GMP-specific phosphodiesterase class I)/GGDEF domain-containing protein
MKQRNHARYFSDQKTFMVALEEAIAHASKQALEGALVLLHVENYATIMDLYGASFAGTLLTDTMHYVATVLAPDDAVLQLSLDTWAVLLSQVSRRSLVHKVDEIRTLMQQYSSKVQPDDAPTYLSCFAGAVDFPRLSHDAGEILAKSYIAMKQASTERNYEVVTYAMVAKAQYAHKKSLNSVHELQKALNDHKLVLAYQPVANARTGRYDYHECLLRLVQEDGTIISAGPHIMVAETMGLVDEIDMFVFESVYRELKDYPDITLSMNVSGSSLEGSAWLQKCQRLLRHNPQVAERLIIEITETAMQKNLAKAAYFVAHLQGLGCQVALDDFGSGNTSFRQLKTLSLDIIKIDGSFIRDITENPDNHLLVKVIMEICQGFGFKSVAEFVENGEIAKTLIDLKVDYLQGFYFSPGLIKRPWEKPTPLYP